MDKIEEVTRILDKAYGLAPIKAMGESPQRVALSETNKEQAAQQICQLFEARIEALIKIVDDYFLDEAWMVEEDWNKLKHTSNLVDNKK